MKILLNKKDSNLYNTGVYKEYFLRVYVKHKHLISKATEALHNLFKSLHVKYKNEPDMLSKLYYKEESEFNFINKKRENGGSHTYSDINELIDNRSKKRV